MMAQNHWWQDPRLAALSVIIGALIGLTYDHLAPFIMITMAIFILWFILQLHRLDRWLKISNQTAPPESHGVWGSVFDKIYFLQKQEKNAFDQLQGIINRAQESANSLSDGVITIKSDGTLEWWNLAANHLIGLQYPRDLGQQLTHLWRNPDLAAYFGQKDYRSPLPITSPYSANTQLEVQISLFGKDDRLMLVRDVTRVHNLEQMRTDFVANVSHELRTPLTVIKGYLENFSAYIDNFQPPVQRGIQQMCDQAMRMESLVNDLLLLSKLETSDQVDDEEPIEIRPLLLGVCNEAKVISEDKAHSIELEMAEDFAINGSTKEVRSAISNLAINAVKYTPDEGQITIKAFTRTVEGKRQAVVCVCDDGEGIEESHIPRLTERFYRADASRNQKTGGTGLGLAIVKHVMLRHDGEMMIESTLGEGSQFHCIFPYHRISRR